MGWRSYQTFVIAVLVFLIVVSVYYDWNHNLLESTDSEPESYFISDVRMRNEPVNNSIVPRVTDLFVVKQAMPLTLIAPTVVCTDDNDKLYILLMYKCVQENFEHRLAVRKLLSVYKHPKHTVRAVFLMGKSEKVYRDVLLSSEAREYGDILQGDFLDVYRNLTIKMIFGWHWFINRNCQSMVSYMMSIDIDVYLNHLNLIQLLQSRGDGPLYLGFIYQDAIVDRDRSSKWYIPPEYMSREYYPPYAAGLGYVLSSSTIPILYNATGRITPIFIDDVYCGLLAEDVDLVTSHSSLFDPSYDHAPYSYCYYRKLIIAHSFTPSLMMNVFRDVFVKKNHDFQCPDWN